MSHYRNYSFVALLVILLAGCGSSLPNQVDILPADCTLEPGSEMTLALDGHISDNAIVTWQADRGSVAFTGQGLNVVYTAPQTPGDVNISAIITSGTPIPQSLTRTCHVNGGIAGPPIPTNAEINTSIIGPTAERTVMISEVMANPCGGDEFRKWNQYIELYNYGDHPQDVANLWLTVSGAEGKSDMLIAWARRNPNIPFSQSLITNTTIIPAHGFAVVLSPIYTQSLDPHRMPYRFVPGTVILTIADGDRIGNRFYGMIGQGGGRSAVVLYLGGAKSILEVLSTYGSPTLARYPQDIRDDRADNLPLDLHECGSAERVDPLGQDIFENWHEVLDGSPGEAPYR